MIEVEDIRKKAYKKWSAKYHPYIDKTIETTLLELKSIPINGFYFGMIPDRYILEQNCFQEAEIEVQKIIPKTGWFSFIFWLSVRYLISWIIKQLLDRYYGRNTRKY